MSESFVQISSRTLVEFLEKSLSNNYTQFQFFPETLI